MLGLLASRGPTILAMFLLGMWAGRTGLLSDVWAHLERWGRIRTVAWSVGLPVQVAVVAGTLLLPPVNAFAALFFNQAFTGPMLAVAELGTGSDRSGDQRAGGRYRGGRVRGAGALGSGLARPLPLRTAGVGAALSHLRAAPAAPPDAGRT